MHKVYLLVLFIFISVTAVLFTFHEPWRDEAQAWLIVRDSHALNQIVHQVSYEESPGLWHITIFPLAKLGLPFTAMRIIHSILAIITVILILTRAPFPIYIRVLLPFSYYFLYEYNIIARNYALSVLFFYLLAIVYPRRHSYPMYYAVSLFFLSLTNAHSLIFTVIISGIWIIEKISSHNRVKQICIYVIPIVGVFLSYYWTQLEHTNTVTWTSWSLQKSQWAMYLERTHTVLKNAYLPLNTFADVKLNLSLLQSLVSITIPRIVVVLFSKYRQWGALLIFILSSLSVGLVAVFKAPTGFRHDGFIFIISLYCLWITYRKIESRSTNLILTIIVIAQVIGGLAVIPYEVQKKFSASIDTLAYLQNEQYLNNHTSIASYPSFMAASLLAPINYPRCLYMLDRQRCESYTQWDAIQSQNRALPASEVIHRANVYFNKLPSSQKVLILSENIDKDTLASHGYQEKQCFSSDIMYEEWYCVYKKL